MNDEICPKHRQKATQSRRRVGPRRDTKASPNCILAARSARVLDVVAAVDALERSARELTPAQPARHRRPTAASDLEHVAGVTPLVAMALSCSGLASDALLRSPLFSEVQHRAPQPRSSPQAGMTLGAFIALRAADRAGRCGADPVTAVRHSRAVLAKYVSLLPESLLRSWEGD